MECSVSAETTKSRDFTNAFMFTEEQITKQLADMREQTDFMKKFRCALGLALREIKTLRTTVSPEAGDETNTEHMWDTSRSPSVSILGGTDLSTSRKENASSAETKCVCSEFGQADLQILKEYLSKMTLEDEELNLKSSFRFKATHNCCDAKTIKESGNLIEDSIRHIERLKQHVAERSTTVGKLCQQLTKARLIRIKRETKLEQKLKEIAEWKEKHQKVRKSNENLAKITKGLRVALNIERQRVESSQKMAHGLEETRKAFQSLKSQAGQLMMRLREKDYEIAELTARLEELQERGGVDVTQQNCNDSASNGCFGDASIQTEVSFCAECLRHAHEVKDLNDKYERLGNAFEDYRKRYPISDEHYQQTSHYPGSVIPRAPQNHLYGRRKMHAPYVSPDSYRRVSRPPLRRRLHHEMNSDSNRHKTQNGNSKKDNPRQGSNTENTLMSPIDEYDEKSEDLRTVSESDKKSHDFAIVQSPPDLQTGLTRENTSYRNFHGQVNSHNVAMVQSFEDIQMGLTHERHHPAYENITAENGNIHGQSSSCDAAVIQSSPDFQTGFAHKKTRLAHKNESSIISQVSDHSPGYSKDDQSLRFVEKVSLHNDAASSSTDHATSSASFHESLRVALHQKRSVDLKQFSQSEGQLTKQVNCKSNHESPINQSPCRKSSNNAAKTSYLELGNSGSSSPCNSVNSGQLEEMTQPLCMNSFIRYNSSHDCADTVSEQSSLSMDEPYPQGRDFRKTSTRKERESPPMSFGVVWHPTLIAENRGNGKTHEHFVSPNSTQNADGAYSNPRFDPHNETAYKHQKSKHGGHSVCYRGHKIDVTDFSIHAFREIIWSLDGGPEASDDFIKFLASLAKKLNSSPKWTGKHSMGNPADWLALRGLY